MSADRSSLDDFLMDYPSQYFQLNYLLQDDNPIAFVEPPETCPYILESADQGEPVIEAMTPREKALCDAARRDERASIVRNLLEVLAIIRKNKEGVKDSLPFDIAAERTEYIADQIRRGML